MTVKKMPIALPALPLAHTRQEPAKSGLCEYTGRQMQLYAQAAVMADRGMRPGPTRTHAECNTIQEILHPGALQLSSEDIFPTFLLVSRGIEDLDHYLATNDPEKDGYSAAEAEELKVLQGKGREILAGLESAAAQATDIADLASDPSVPFSPRA